MKRQLLTIAVVLIALAGPASAGELRADRRCLGEKLATTTLDASSSSFSITIPNDGNGYDLMIPYFKTVDADDSVTAITMSCTASEDNNSTDATIQDCTVSAGACTSDDASWIKNPGSATRRWPWRVDIGGLQDIECTLTDTGGDASDSINVYEVCLVTK